jgi:hypothetical protein
MAFDQHLYKLGWGQSGLLGSFELNGSDFTNGKPNEKKLVDKMIKSFVKNS